MKEWKTITPEEITTNPFRLIGKEWMLVTAEMNGKANTMTASWGGVGVLWNKPVAFVFLRPQRYTREFVDSSDTLSLSFYGESEEAHKTLTYLGRVSGRDEDEIAKSGLTLTHEDGVPFFEEARMVLLGRKLYCQQMNPESFLIPGLAEKNYPQKDYHFVYVVEIEKVLMEQEQA